MPERQVGMMKSKDEENLVCILPICKNFLLLSEPEATAVMTNSKFFKSNRPLSTSRKKRN